MLQGIPDVETLELLSVSCNTIEPSQKSGQISEQTMKDKSCISKYLNNNATIDDKCNHKINYFAAGLDRESDLKAIAKLEDSIYKEFAAVFSGIGCFKGAFSLQVKEYKKPYQASLRHMAYILQESPKKESDSLQKYQDIIPLDVDKTAEWCNSFMLVP